MTLVEECIRQEIPKSIGLIGNAADIFPELVLRGVIPDVVTDQTSAHDVLMYVPSGISLSAAERLRESDSGRIRTPVDEIHGSTCRSHAGFPKGRR